MNRTRGSTMALGVLLTMLLVVVGMFVFGMSLIFGGSREVDYLTQSGALNVAKQATNPQTRGVALKPGDEAANFTGVSNGGMVDVQSYNRIVAKALLVALNAQSEGTPEASANAAKLVGVLKGSGSLTQRLYNKLNDPVQSLQAFADVNKANSNSLRMLGSSAQPMFDMSKYEVACVGTGGDSNVYIDTSILPSNITVSGSNLSSHKSKSGMPYLKGYSDISAGGFTFQTAPVAPNQQPHLISARDFAQGKTLAQSSSQGNAAIPNAFKVAVKATNTAKAGSNLTTAAYAIVGATGNASDFQVSIPDGYIMVYSSPNGTDTTINGWLDYTGATGDFRPQMYQRAREIYPALTQAQFNSLLDATIHKGERLYISMNPDKATSANKPLVISATPPTSAAAQVSADGGLQHYCPDPYNHAVWYPSSGYNNKLGTLIIWSGEVIGPTLDSVK